MFDAGRMRERITIQRQENVKNSRGGLTRTWVPLIAGLSAEMINLSGREALIGQALQGIGTFQIKIRFREDIKAADQILWRGPELNIHSAEDRLGTRQWLVIHASTEAPQGA